MSETAPTTSRATAGTVRPERAAEMEAQDFVDGLPRGITSSTLLAILQLRMQGQDQSIALYAEGIKANTDLGDEVLGIMQELLLLKSEGATTGGNDDLRASDHAASQAAGAAVTAAGGSDAEAAAAVEAHFAAYLAGLAERASAAGLTLSLGTRTTDSAGDPAPLWIAGDVIGAGIDCAKQKLSEINSGNEMEMIRLQEVMQQRSSGVQLFTNLLKQLSDSQMAVIRNISG